MILDNLGVMSNKSDNLEVVYEGWLTKSPPTKRIWRARWRKRWFVLKNSGELPGQYFLYYYTDRNCRRLKGEINLDHCEQVDAGLRFENRKQKYQFMFDLKTPKRTYYLAADSENDMNKWVECICQVCGLKAYADETNGTSAFGYGIEDEPSIAGESNNTDSPPLSPTSTVSGPYILISECISGSPVSSPDDLKALQALQQQLLNEQNQQAKQTNLQGNNQINQRQNLQNQPKVMNGIAPELYDAPRKLQPPNLELKPSNSITPPINSPATDPESVFTDEEWTNPHPKPVVNWDTFPKPSESSEGDLPLNKVAQITVNQRFTKTFNDIPDMPKPPRPPKPAHLIVDNPEQHHYLNLGNIELKDSKMETKDDVSVKPIVGVSDEMYDFPRTHNIESENQEPLSDEKNDPKIPIPMARHCYTNAAPSKVGNGNVFRYDFPIENPVSQRSQDQESPLSVVSEATTVPLYSNLPSPATSLNTPTLVNSPSVGPSGPPIVNRELKPGRKTSESAVSNEPSPLMMTGSHPPPCDRALKPTPAMRKKTLSEQSDDVFSSPLKLCPPPLGRVSYNNYGNFSSLHRRAGPPVNPIIRRHSDSSEPDLRTIGSEVRSRDSRMGSLNFYGFQPFNDIQYLDLDLEGIGHKNSSFGKAIQSSQAHHSTVYKTIDFFKTEAIKRTAMETRNRQHRNQNANIS